MLGRSVFDSSCSFPHQHALASNCVNLMAEVAPCFSPQLTDQMDQAKETAKSGNAGVQLGLATRQRHNRLYPRLVSHKMATDLDDPP